METMKAVRVHRFGGPQELKIEEVPRPEPSANQVLIRVRAASVNPLDWKIRAGYMQAIMPIELPWIPGYDVAGTVEAVGADVQDLQVGDEVWATTPGGGYAEYVALDASGVSRKPASLDFVDAASVPVAGLTAWQALFDVGNLQAGQTVLIHAAAGGVGSLAVQLAKWKGARVVGTASGANTDYVRSLNADQVIDYKNSRFEDAVSEIDLVLDAVGGDVQARSFQVLKPGGKLVAITAPPDESAAQARGVQVQFMAMQPKSEQLQQLAELFDQGALQTQTEVVLRLEDVARAHEQSETGHARGKIVLQIAR